MSTAEFYIKSIRPAYKGETVVLLDADNPDDVVECLKTVFGPPGRNRRYLWRVQWVKDWNKDGLFGFRIFVRDPKLLTQLQLLAN